MKKSVLALVCILAFGLATAIAQAPSKTTTPRKPAGTATTKKPAAAGAATKKSATATKPGVTTLKDTKEKFSYALGMNLGANLHKQSVEIDPEIFKQGLQDAIAEKKPLLTEEEAAAVMKEMQTIVQAKMQAMSQQLGEKNKKEGEAFLAANKGKEGVVTLPSGLQYKVLTQGTGPKPEISDVVSCNYRGTLLNGKEFDSSYKRGQPASFPVSGVIKGWTEALQLMSVGSKYQLFIPPQLAYGDRGAGGDIEPNSTLIFEVELLSVQKK